MMAQILLKSLNVPKPSLGVLSTIGNSYRANDIVEKKYSTSSDEEPRQLKNVNLASLKRGTGGRSSFNGMVVSIFGCTGFLGKYLAFKFGKIGSQMIFCYRGDAYDTNHLKPSGDLGQVLFHFYDIRDENAIRNGLKHSNVVVNLVGREWETNNFKFKDVHVDGARRIAKAAREMGVERLIHLSSMNVSPNPEPIFYKNGSQFLKSKYYGELAVLEEFPNATIIRPADMYGQADHFLWYYQHIWRRQFHNLPVWKKGEKTIKAPVFGGDVAQAIVNAAKDPQSAGRIYQGVGQYRYRLSELLDYFHRVWHRDNYDWEYKRTDLRYDPFFQLKIWATEKFRIANPIGELHRERVEREYVDDVILEGVPTLEDLGVKLTLIEDQVPFDSKAYVSRGYYVPKPGEYPEYGRPKPLDKNEQI